MKRIMTDAQKLATANDMARLTKMRHAIDDEIALRRIKDSTMAGLDAGHFTDATPAALMERALEYAVAQGVYEIEKYTVWRDVLPLDRDMPAGANTKRYTVWSGSGKAAWYRGGGRFPNVSIGQKPIDIPFHSMTSAFSLDWIEMRASGYAGVSVEAEKAKRAYMALDEKVEELVFLGDAAMARPPLINHPLVETDGLATGDWDNPATTAALIITDIQGVINAIVENCNGDKAFKNLKVSLMCSPQIYRILTSTVANAYSNETIAQVLAKVDGKFGTIIESPMHGVTAGGSGDNVSFGPFDDPESNVVALSVDAERVPPDNRGHYINQPFETKFGIYHCKYPDRFFAATGAV